MLSAGQFDGMHDWLAAAEHADGFGGGGEFIDDACAFHGEHFAAFFYQGQAPFDEEIHRADGAGYGDVAGIAQFAPACGFGALGDDFDVAQGEFRHDFLQEGGFLFGGFEEDDFGVGAGDGEDDAGNAAATADVSEAKSVRREEREKGKSVAHVLHLGGGAIGDAGEVHVLVGLEEKVDVGGEFGVLIFGEGQRGFGGELVPEFIHARVFSMSSRYARRRMGRK